MGDETPIDETVREAQELIAAVYGQIVSLRAQGKEATKIVLPPRQYRILQEYRRSVGDVPHSLPDYLGRYDLFGIPLYTDTREHVVIQARPVERPE
ncbi:MAG: hypothetical protein ACOC2V_01330 [Alkalispirochaeta sp.]